MSNKKVLIQLSSGVLFPIENFIEVSYDEDTGVLMYIGEEKTLHTTPDQLVFAFITDAVDEEPVTLH